MQDEDMNLTGRVTIPTSCAHPRGQQISHFSRLPRQCAWLLQKIASPCGFNARPVRVGQDMTSLAECPSAGSDMYAEMSPLWLFNHYCEPARSSRKLLPLGHCRCHLRTRCMQRTRFGKEARGGSRLPLHPRSATRQREPPETFARKKGPIDVPRPLPARGEHML